MPEFFEISLGNQILGSSNGRAFGAGRARAMETLPALQHDPNRPEDVLKVDADEDGVGGDDAADALRNLVVTKGRVVAQRNSGACD